MSPQRYEPVNSQDENQSDNEDTSPRTARSHQSTPSSPPPSFRSGASSPTFRRLLSHDDPLDNEADQTLADTFDDGVGSDDEDGSDDRQKLMRGDPDAVERDTEHQQEHNSTSTTNTTQRTPIQRRVTELPVFAPTTLSRHQPRSNNDGVFANLAAKPERGETTGDEKPPTYEAAAADATPPYWETTITLPGSGVPGSDEVYVDGLPVGSIFSFAWNAMISMSFQLVGFLLTYLLHTTHAAKNGSRAGLGLTLVQYGFYMKGSPSGKGPADGGADPGGQFGGGGGNGAPPSDPNSHDFDPSSVAAAAAAAAAASSSASAGSSSSAGGLADLASSDWVAYILMIVGWFILIRAVSDFLRARRHEALVLQSPDRGLPVPVIAEGEGAERVV